MKKAYLVDFYISTRVVVDENVSEDEIIKIAQNKILSDPSSYIIDENAVTYDDVEMPYDESYDK